MKVRSLLLAIALCASAAPALGQQDSSAPAAPAQVGSSFGPAAAPPSLETMGIKKYLLGPGDQLDLRVFNEA